MNRQDFRQAVRQKLSNVPLATRRAWKGTDLLIWWQTAKTEDSYLRLDGCVGDDWQEVHGMCVDMIGEQAVT